MNKPATVPGKTKPRIAVYTAITNQYNALLNPTYRDPDIDYYCFSDQTLWNRLVNNTVWKTLPFPEPTLDPVRKCRMVKTLPHRFFAGYDYSVWVDGSIDIIDDVRKLIEQYDRPSMLCFKHPLRSCIYVEGQACIDVGKDDPETITRQLDGYRQQGFPEQAGLIESNALVRRHNDPDLVEVMEDWWHEIKTRSRRDQLSLPYVLRKHDYQVTLMGEDNVTGPSPFFRLRMHTRHGDGGLGRWEKLQALADAHLLWRFKRKR